MAADATNFRELQGRRSRGFFVQSPTAWEQHIHGITNSGGIAPPGQCGCAFQENAAPATETAQTGWLFENNFLSNHPGATRHPSCPGGTMPREIWLRHGAETRGL